MWEILQVLYAPAMVIYTLLVAAGLWMLGVRDEFILTAIALAIGIPIGWLVDRRQFLAYRRDVRRREPEEPKEPKE